MAVPQPLHILQKDLRHLLPETLVTLFFFVAYAFTASYDATSSDFGPVIIKLVELLLTILMPITWAVVISRLIQDEPLVGDRQFWTSRPYHWASLMASKALFLLLFLYLPFLSMQVFLLKHAGLFPTTVIPALLHNLLLLTVVIVVPIAVISAVTTSFVWVLLSLLGGIVYCLVCYLLVLYFKLRYLSPPTLNPVLYAIMIGLPLGVLVFQYARRRTNLSRILLLAAPLAVVLIVLAVPTGALIRQAYPLAGSGTDVPKLEAWPEQLRPKQPDPGTLEIHSNKVEVGIPFTVAGIDRESNYVIDGTALTIDAPGLHWSSPYLAGSSLLQRALHQTLQLNAGSGPFGVGPAEVPVDVFDKLRNLPADVHLSLAAEHFKAGKEEVWKANAGSFSVPGNGVCKFDKANPLDPPICRYPFKSPELNVVEANVTQGSCGAGVPAQPARMRLEGKPAGLDFDPVVTVPLNFPVATQDPQARPQSQTVCAGTPLTFVEAKSVGRIRFEIEEKQLLLNNFARRIPPPAPAGQPSLEPGPPQR
jgi:hypothetical protein